MVFFSPANRGRENVDDREVERQQGKKTNFLTPKKKGEIWATLLFIQLNSYLKRYQAERPGSNTREPGNKKNTNLLPNGLVEEGLYKQQPVSTRKPFFPTTKEPEITTLKRK